MRRIKSFRKSYGRRGAAGPSLRNERLRGSRRYFRESVVKSDTDAVEAIQDGLGAADTWVDEYHGTHTVTVVSYNMTNAVTFEIEDGEIAFFGVDPTKWGARDIDAGMLREIRKMIADGDTDSALDEIHEMWSDWAAEETKNRHPPTARISLPADWAKLSLWAEDCLERAIEIDSKNYDNFLRLFGL